MVQALIMINVSRAGKNIKVFLIADCIEGCGIQKMFIAIFAFTIGNINAHILMVIIFQTGLVPGSMSMISSISD